MTRHGGPPVPTNPQDVVGMEPLTPEPPVLEELSPESRGRIIHFIVTSTLGGGVAPVAVAALYADLAGDARAVQYADYRFTLRQLPPGWAEIEDRVVDLAEAARSRDVDLSAAWQRVMETAMRAEDPLEQLARLAGVPASTVRPNRSIFDDPDDLDELEELDESLHVPLQGRLPELIDLDALSRQRISRYAIEERLEHGLAPYELLELYRFCDEEGDGRARQYLDRIFVEPRDLPLDWQGLKASAGELADLADRHGQDAGEAYANVLRASPGIDPVNALHLLVERLQRR